MIIAIATRMMATTMPPIAPPERPLGCELAEEPEASRAEEPEGESAGLLRLGALEVE